MCIETDVKQKHENLYITISNNPLGLEQVPAIQFTYTPESST